MADDPWAMLDQIAGPEGAQTVQQSPPNATPPTGAAATRERPSDPWAMLDHVAGPEKGASELAGDASPSTNAGQFATTNPTGNRTDTVSADVAERSEKRRSEIASILNGEGSDDEVRARLGAVMARDGQSITDLGGLDAALKSRASGARIGVGLKHDDALDVPKPKLPDNGVVNAFGHGAVDALTLGGARWIHGFGHAIGLDGEGQSAFSSGENFFDSMADGRKNWDAMTDGDWDNHPIAYGAGEVAGSLVLPAGGEVSLGARVIPAAVGRIAMGAGQAGAMGFLHGEKSIGDRLRDGADSALVGAGIGGALEGGGATISRMLRGDGVAQDAARDTYAAADRLNASASADQQIAPLPAHVGGPAVRGATSALKHTIIAGGGIESGLHDFVSATQGARDRIADAIAPGISTVDRDAIGAKLSSDSDPMGLQAWEDRWKTSNDKNYKRAIWLSNDAQIPTPQTIGALDRRISELSGAPGNPHANAVARLQSLRDDLAGNSYNAEKLRLTRSDWGKSVDANDGVLRGMAKTLYGTLSQDIDAGLRSQGHIGAAQHWAKADRAYAEGLDFLRNDFPKVLGRDGGADADRVLSNIEGLVNQGKTSTLTRVLGQAPADVSAQVRGKIISGLGRTVLDPASGKVGFSAPIFIRQWDKMSSTAKNALFDPATISSLNDVRTISAAAVRSGISDNTSKTSATTANRGLIDAMGFMGEGMLHLMTHTASLATGGGALLAHLGTEAGMGYLLSKPGVARAIAGVQRGTPNAQAILQCRIAGALARTPKRLLTLPATANGIMGTGDDGEVPTVTVPPHQATLPLIPTLRT